MKITVQKIGEHGGRAFPDANDPNLRGTDTRTSSAGNFVFKARAAKSRRFTPPSTTTRSTRVFSARSPHDSK
jgi:hypothetical protein